MSLAYYLDDISERHDSLNIKEAYIQKKSFLFFYAIALHLNIREAYRKTKKTFNSSKYKNSINNISQEDFIQIKEQLVEVHKKIERTISILVPIEKARVFHWIFSRSKRSLEKEKEFIEEKIFDFQFGVNPEFSSALYKIADGIEKNCLKDSKLGHIGPTI